MATRLTGRDRRRRRIRKKISGSPERPRLTVFRSNKHIYAQVVDDLAGATIAQASSLGREGEPSKKLDTAAAVGEAVAAACASKGVQKVVFDRNGYMYHGRVRALADGARKGGLQF
jgi:large subunit ribosomal protein L18